MCNVHAYIQRNKHKKTETERKLATASSSRVRARSFTSNAGDNRIYSLLFLHLKADRFHVSFSSVINLSVHIYFRLFFHCFSHSFFHHSWRLPQFLMTYFKLFFVTNSRIHHVIMFDRQICVFTLCVLYLFKISFHLLCSSFLVDLCGP